MHPLNQLEHMLDGMGLEYTGDLVRVPELERREGEYCYRDDAGVVYRMYGLELDVEEPHQLRASDEKPEELFQRLARELQPWAAKRAKNAAPPPQAVSLLETGGLFVSAQRNEQLCRAFRDGSFPEWRRKLIYRGLKGEDELTLCALHCGAACREACGLPALARVTDEAHLFTVAVAAHCDELRSAALRRFAGDRAMLRAVRDWQGKTVVGFTQTVREAGQLLAALEEEQLRDTPDEDKVTELLLGGELVQAVRPALRRIEREENLLKLLLADLDRGMIGMTLERAKAIRLGDSFKNNLTELVMARRLKGCEEAALELLEREQLFRIATKGPDERLRSSADQQLCALVREQEKESGEPRPLLPEQREALLQRYAALHSLRDVRCVELLDADRKHRLFLRRLEAGESTEGLLGCVRGELLTEEDCCRLFHARDAETRAFAEQRIRGLTTELLRDIVLTKKDLPLQSVAFEELRRRGAPLAEPRKALDETVLPMIESARTPDGYDGKKICDVFRALPPSVAAEYGFVLEHDEGETQDGEDWESERLSYDGGRWWLFYTQTDGGGEWRSYGSPC